jgi:hypothetical protein
VIRFGPLKGHLCSCGNTKEKTRWGREPGKVERSHVVCCRHVVGDKSEDIGRRLEKERKAWGLLLPRQSRAGSLIRIVCMNVHSPVKTSAIVPYQGGYL